jgi:hypothetical protein
LSGSSSHDLNPLIRQPGDVLLEGAVDEAVVRPGALDGDALAYQGFTLLVVE